MASPMSDNLQQERERVVEKVPGVETEQERLDREQQELIEEALRMNF